tara:strand:+ start:53 stop:421 length:369 start_codon:yes stop_codon:yes gene_type:complete
MNPQSQKQDVLKKGQKQPILASLAWCEMRIAKIINGDEIIVKTTKEIVMINGRQDDDNAVNNYDEFIKSVINKKIAQMIYIKDYEACKVQDINNKYINNNGSKGTIISFKIDPIMDHTIATK